ncbi:Hypothetical protein Minf_0447 [Methylacidiphilum infernorum V4]|uniref:Uncharacterized protein n=1 Tax=Methylacidiphilum infernorum (isolate V4) TaxID=481448 RepID=B3DYY3_METI4|nr:Hypothetical protein Minf_0447 [Methylacidiphilum infernorum V4]
MKFGKRKSYEGISTKKTCFFLFTFLQNSPASFLKFFRGSTKPFPTQRQITARFL